MRVKDVMQKKVVTIDRNQNLQYAVELLEKHRISRLPVVDKDVLVGIVTERDIARSLGSSMNDRISPAHVHMGAAMSKELVTIAPGDAIETAAARMLEKNISGLPVLENDRLAGLVTKTDLMRLLSESKVKVGEIMARDPMTLTPASRVIHARKLLFDYDISRVPVVDDSRLVGMLSERDVALAFNSFRRIVARQNQPSRVENLLVGDIMRQDLRSASPESTVGEAVSTMIEHHISGLPVLVNNTLVGVITKTDIIKLLAPSQ